MTTRVVLILPERGRAVRVQSSDIYPTTENTFFNICIDCGKGLMCTKTYERLSKEAARVGILPCGCATFEYEYSGIRLQERCMQ